jgi:L-asparaginase/Glu-tRNA(Gln) amidotransferase subunit D
MTSQYPEARVLIIMTGGTICMKHSPEGLVPARGFLVEGMAPRPSFNDGSQPGMFRGIKLFRSFVRSFVLHAPLWFQF